MEGLCFTNNGPNNTLQMPILVVSLPQCPLKEAIRYINGKAMGRTIISTCTNFLWVKFNVVLNQHKHFCYIDRTASPLLPLCAVLAVHLTLQRGFGGSHWGGEDGESPVVLAGVEPYCYSFVPGDDFRMQLLKTLRNSNILQLRLFLSFSDERCSMPHKLTYIHPTGIAVITLIIKQYSELQALQLTLSFNVVPKFQSSHCL